MNRRVRAVCINNDVTNYKLIISHLKTDLRGYDMKNYKINHDFFLIFEEDSL